MKHFTMLDVGATVGERFQITDKLGQGSTSCVYKAKDLKTNTFIALKILDPFLMQDPVNIERLRRESEILRKLNHSNIIKIYDLEFSENLKYLVMEYFQGQDLKKYIKENSERLDWERTLRLTKKIVETLLICHAEGVVHRDLKPQNILVNENDEIKIMDFGVSKVSGMSDLTKTGTMIGTPEYMAPELFRKATLDFRADIYSIGCTLYELLCGVPPFLSTQISQLLNQKMNPDSIHKLDFNPRVPDWLRYIVMKCLRVDPILRYQNCQELFSDLLAKEKALAEAEIKAERAICIKCRTELLPGFTFCYNCGTFHVSLFTKGKFSLVIHASKDSKRLSKYLSSIFSDISELKFYSGLQKLPFVLLERVDDSTAKNLANEIIHFQSNVQVSDNMSREYNLPMYLLLFGIGGAFLPFFYPQIRSNSILQVLSILLVEFLLYTLYKGLTRPLISSKNFENREKSIPKYFINAVEKLRHLNSEVTKGLIARIIQKYLRMGPEEFVLEEFEDTIEKAFDWGREIGTFEEQLKSQNLLNLKTDIQRLEIKIKNDPDLRLVPKLSESKSSLKQYYEFQDSHSNYRMRLLNLMREVDLKKAS